MKHDSQKKKEIVAFLGRRKENLKGEKKQTDDMEFSHNKTWMMTYRYLAFLDDVYIHTACSSASKTNIYYIRY